MCLEQDKLIFKDFIEEETKFRYVEKLFLLELEISKNTDENIHNFIKTLGNFPHIKQSFLLVKKINRLKQEIDREARFRGAQKIKNFKRCIFNFEENFRQEQSKPGNQGKGFLEVLPKDQTIEVVKLYKKTNKQDFNCNFFNSVVKPAQASPEKQSLVNNFSRLTLSDEEVKMRKMQAKFSQMMSQTYMIEKLRS